MKHRLRDGRHERGPSRRGGLHFIGIRGSLYHSRIVSARMHTLSMFLGIDDNTGLAYESVGSTPDRPVLPITEMCAEQRTHAAGSI